MSTPDLTRIVEKVHELTEGLRPIRILVRPPSVGEGGIHKAMLMQYGVEGTGKNPAQAVFWALSNLAQHIEASAKLNANPICYCHDMYLEEFDRGGEMLLPGIPTHESKMDQHTKRFIEIRLTTTRVAPE